MSAALLAGCGEDAVQVGMPDLESDDVRACAALVDALPDTLADQPRRPVEPEDAPAAAYGDPAIVVECGARMPRGFDRFASCDEVNGVGWYLPPEQLNDPTQEGATDATLGTVGWRPVVGLRVPAEHRPEGVAAALAQLAPVVKQHLRQVRPCV